MDAKQTTLPDKTALEESAYIDLDGADGKAYTIKGNTVITYTNEKAKEQKLRIHKVGDDAEGGLAGATFSLTAAEGTTIEDFTNKAGLVSMDNTTPANHGYLPSGESDATLFTLSVGTYTLTETEAPQYYDGIDGAVTLSVTGEGISITSVGDDTEDPFEDVKISDPDTDGVYTLTITNTRKKANVTIIKNVTGTNADKDAQYSFTATGLTETEDFFQLYGQHKDAVEETPEQKNSKVYEDIPHGTLFVVIESDAYTDFTTTITATYVDGEGVEQTITLDPGRKNKLSTGDITVNADVTITFTNERKQQWIEIVKKDVTGTKALAGARFSISDADIGAFKIGNSVSGTDGYLGNAADAANENTKQAVFLLETGIHTLTETEAPAGYNMMSGTVSIAVGPGGVTYSQTDHGGDEPQTAVPRIVEIEGVDYTVYTVIVYNNPGVQLPSTGGPGTHLLYFLGAVLTVLSGAGLVMGKRRRVTPEHE